MQRVQEEEEKEKGACGVRVELSWAAAPGSSRPQQKSWSGGGERQKAERREIREVRKAAHCNGWAQP